MSASSARRSGFLALLIPLALAACEIPQPFRHEGSPPVLTRPKAPRGVAVRPLPDAAIGPALAEAMTQELMQRDIPAAPRQSLAGGYLLEVGIVAEGERVGLDWRLTGPDREEVATHAQTLAAAEWAAASPDTARRLAAEAAARLSPLLRDDDDQSAVAAMPRGPVVSLAPLHGLPGDGDRALATAMRAALERLGILVRETGADYIVEGKAVIGPGLPGQDAVDLIWIVRDAGKGVELGSAAQQGAVPKGRLNGPWGSLASDMAEGGADGVGQILDRLKRY